MDEEDDPSPSLPHFPDTSRKQDGVVHDRELDDEDIPVSYGRKAFFPYLHEFNMIGGFLKDALSLPVCRGDTDLDPFVTAVSEDRIDVVPGFDAGRPLIALFVPDFFCEIVHFSRS